MLKEVLISYTNHRGEKGLRHITPLHVHFGSNEWHTDQQWLLTAYDHDKKANREFAMKDIWLWSPIRIDG